MSTNVTPVTNTPMQIQKQEIPDMAKAVENSNNVAKTCSYVALGTSVATLLPLSILAVKTSKISKAAESLEKGAKPILENLRGASAGVREVSENIAGVTRSAKEACANIGANIGELFKSEELKTVLKELQNKVKDVDIKNLVGELKLAISDFTNSVNKKVGEVDVQNLNELLKTIKVKISELNVKDLSDSARSILEKIKGKFKPIQKLSPEELEKMLHEADDVV